MNPEASQASSSSAPPSKLKIAGAWSGALEVALDSWTLSKLRDEVFRRSGAGGGCSVKLICGGKILKECDDGQSLAQLGLRNNSKILAIIVSPDKGKALNEALASEAERSQTLTRLKAAADALVKRHAGQGSLPLEDFSMELEDQSGQKLQLGSETDQKGAMMGVMLHTNGKSLIEKEKYKEALDVLTMAEESFSLCDPKLLEMIDNFPILQLDIVWCYFMLRDVSCLSVAGMRLAQARKGFERSHGRDSSRFRVLLEGRHQELAIYLRLELLAGVVAYYTGNYEESRKALNSAQARFNQLQVPDEALSQLMSMGYKEHAAKRALRMTGQDIGSAVDFLVEERARKIRRHEEDLRRQAEIMEQRKYGTTQMGKAVDIKRLNELASIGFARELAAEALRRNENDTQLALDLLTNPDENCKLQRKLEERKQKSTRKKALAVEEGSSVLEAPAEAEAEAAVAAATGAAEGNLSVDEAPVEVEAAAATGAAEGNLLDVRDVEMENELVNKLTGDAVADYDIDITKEGEAIAEYLLLLDSLVPQPNGCSL